ncbi:hypothetical protein NQ315_001557 [Exocentrus adspersus]|uniref:Uncharacterized protein n=1 Tax=Exocentrus adspersus TaxID=1586481 RepID=A0AAV8W993_9CUCU|nr:hypothetical protein NQ315_001557 [Exocentrus adspersus]
MASKSSTLAVPFKRNERLLAGEARNRAQQAKLEAELARIEREKQSDLRRFNAEHQKFKSKFSKSSQSSDAALDYVVPKSTPSPEATAPRHFQQIHSLIFTDDEVDVEKVLCLHLLSVHRTETLAPPKKNLQYMCKVHSPCERLIDRSKKGFTNFERLSKMLPLFAVELVEHGAAVGEKPNLINDGRLAARALINEKLMQIVNAVATTLEKSNAEKFKQLLLLGNNPAQMRRMLGNRRVGDFLDSLFDCSLLTRQGKSNCESYVLTPPFRIKVVDLDVRTRHGNLEHLVTHLRQNVLQEPRKIEKDVNREPEQPPEAGKKSFKPKMQKKLPSIASSAGSSGSRLSTMMDLKRNVSGSSSGEEKTLGSYKRINYITKNIQAASKTKRIQYDTDEDEFTFTPPRKRSGSWKSSARASETASITTTTPLLKNLPLPIVLEKESIEENNIKTVDSDSVKENESTEAVIEDQPQEKKSWTKQHESRHHIKQTTCPACMERWKKPLPSPKTPRVNKSRVLPDEYSNYLKTNDHHRISMLINKAMYKLESYDRKYSSENEGSRRVSATKKEVEEEDADKVYLNAMDLAKIEQEIKERETKKKLENFLKMAGGLDKQTGAKP